MYLYSIHNAGVGGSSPPVATTNHIEPSPLDKSISLRRHEADCGLYQDYQRQVFVSLRVVQITYEPLQALASSNMVLKCVIDDGQVRFSSSDHDALVNIDLLQITVRP